MERVLVAIRSIAVGLVALVFVHQTDAATAQGNAIFRRAEAAARSDAHARYATYAVTVAYDNGTRHVANTWDTKEDLTDAVVLASIFSREERAHPSAPTGANLRYSVSIGSGGGSAPATWSSKPLNTPQPDDPIGPVAFAVDQDFGLTPPHAYAVVDDADTFLSDANGLATIGRSGTELQRYAVTLLEADASTDHLALTPLRDPYHNRLRELWVDANDATVKEAIVAGIGDRAPLDRVRWDVTFARDQGGTYVAKERALAPLDYGKSGRLQNAQVTFDDLTLESRFPFQFTLGIETPVQTQHDP